LAFGQARSGEQNKAIAWVEQVKNELARLDLCIPWENPLYFVRKRAKKMIKERITNDSIRLMHENMKLLFLQTHFGEKRPVWKMKPINELGAEKRRIYSKVLLSCPGKIIVRKGKDKLCALCKERVDGSIFVHGMRECIALKVVRKKMYKKDSRSETILSDEDLLFHLENEGNPLPLLNL